MSTKIHPLTGLPIIPIGFRKDGRPIWPILGGDDTVPPAPAAPAAPAAPPAPAPIPAAAPAPAPPSPAPAADRGYPEGTPLEQMTAEQQAAYWKYYARQHEQRNKDLGNLTPEQLAELRTKAEKHDALEFEMLSEKDKAIESARAEASHQALDEFMPKLVAAEFKAAAAGRIDASQIEGIIGPLDKTYFYAADGRSVDATKVAAYIDQIAPAPTAAPPSRRGPSPAGVTPTPSSTSGAAPTASGQDAGRSEYERRHGKRQ